MIKKLLIICMILMTLGTLGFVLLIVSITWDQYQDTKDWENTSFGGDLSTVPPFLARNYVKAEDKEAILIWNEVGQALLQIEEDQGVDDSKRESYEELLARSQAEQESYGLTDGEIALLNQRLSLYLELETALDNAYSNPETETLKDLSNQLYNINVQVQSSVHNVYFDRLNTVASDYENLANFLETVLPELGTIQDQILTVNIEIGSEDTEEIIEALEVGNLRKFSFLDKLYDLLVGETWNVILTRNEISREYYAWMDAKKELEALSKDQYYSVSVINTYQQAVDAGLSIEVEEKDGYMVDPNSPVESLSYNGTILSPDQYIRYGTNVTATIQEEYIPLPQSEDDASLETQEEEIQDNGLPEDVTEQETPDDNWTDEWEDDGLDSDQEDAESQTPSEAPDDGWTEDW